MNKEGWQVANLECLEIYGINYSPSFAIWVRSALPQVQDDSSFQDQLRKCVRVTHSVRRGSWWAMKTSFLRSISTVSLRVPCSSCSLLSGSLFSQSSQTSDCGLSSECGGSWDLPSTTSDDLLASSASPDTNSGSLDGVLDKDNY